MHIQLIQLYFRISATTIKGPLSNLSSATGTWVIDPSHTTIGFSVRHAMVAKVRGNFGSYAGSFTINGDNLPASAAELTIRAASINTNSADRDGHLAAPDFLNVENFPILNFVSTAVAAKGDDIVVTGGLTIHGVTKSVHFKFEGAAKISRKDFGLVWNTVLETGGVLVGDEITLNLDVEANKQ